MTNDILKNKILHLQPNTTFDESMEWLTILVEPSSIFMLMSQIRNDSELNFDYLFCLTAVDFKTHLTVVYHLSSTFHRSTIVIKSNLNFNLPEIESMSSIWLSANFFEREVYEMFGINFINHPDLRLLILPDGWEGKNPLRKNFIDDVNMIKL